MSLEGLNAILNKEEVVFTFGTQDILNRPDYVDARYREHIRTYVPMHSGVAGKEGQDVEDFARRLIRKIKDRRAPRGYVTADFGYGKTSTGLYIWQQATEANLAVVPPFQMNSLLDLIDATYGWIHYLFSQTKPSLQASAIDLYQMYTEHTLEDLAVTYKIDVKHIHDLYSGGKLNLALSSSDIANFFQSMTNLVLEAGFDGLLVIPDEVQQYLEPQIKAGKSDPIGPLFNLIQDIAAHQGELCFGLLFIIPQKELGVINDQRGDLIDRIRELALDLKTIYDQQFPARLWNKLAEEFDFEEHAPLIVCDETLDSLGQIATRGDLSNGPRTVVNAFRRITARYLSLDTPTDNPYTPIDLINDFLDGEIAFDGTKRIQEVASRALGSEIVRKNISLSNAVILAAAFPLEGVKPDLQDKYGLRSAFVELLDSAFGTLVTNIGDRANPGTVLIGLEKTEGNREWLDIVLSEFTRNYYQNAAITKTRAEYAFADLLTTKIFKPEEWSVRENKASELFGHSLSMEGNFSRVAREFPKRLIQIRISSDEAPFEPPNVSADAILDFRLHSNLLDEEMKPLVILAENAPNEHRGLVSLNLSVGDGQLNRALESILTKTISSDRLTPLFLLNLYAHFQERLDRDQVPKDFEPILTSQIQPAILESVLALVITESIGRLFDAAGARLPEVMLSQLLQTRYPAYQTLMVLKQGWQSPLLQYIGALKRLPSFAQKQGDIDFEGTKDDIAGLLSMTNTAFDSFANNYPFFIQTSQPFRGKAKGLPAQGAVRFVKHKLEGLILEWLEKSPGQTMIDEQQVHYLPIDELYKRATSLGYKDDEIRVLTDIMGARDLVIGDSMRLCQKPYSPISIEDIVALLQQTRIQAESLQRAFPEASEFNSAHTRLMDLEQALQDDREFSSNKDLERAEMLARELAITIENASTSRILGLNTLIESLTRRIPYLDQGTRETILIPIQESVAYAGKLDEIRGQLSDQIDTLEYELQHSRELLQQLGEQVQSQNFSLESLANISTEIRKQVTTTDSYGKRIHDLSTNAGLFRDWTRFTTTWTGTVERIQQLGASGNSLAATLLKLEHSILSEFTQHEFTSLSTIHTFEHHLDAISHEIRRIEDEAQHQFRVVQQEYLNALTTTNATGWLPIIFSPLEPEAVYEQLYKQVQTSLIVRIDKLDDLLSQLQSSLRQRILSDERENPVFAETLIATIDNLKMQLPYSEANDPQCIRGKAPKDKNRFNSLIETVANITLEIERIEVELSERHTDLPELTPDETAILNFLSARQSVDVVEILSKFGHGNTVWSVLESLWNKQQIRITLGAVEQHPNKQ